MPENIENVNDKPVNMENYGRDDKGRFIEGHPGFKPLGTKHLNLTTLLIDQLELVPEGKTEAYKILFIKKLLHKALVEGDIQAIKIIINYVDGMPKQTIEGIMTNLNFEFNELSDDELKDRIRKYSGELNIQKAKE